MRVWDVAAGYLNRASLLGEHRELHGLHSILVHGKKGYSRHPETLRWVGCVAALARRHAILADEMALRGYVDRTPLVVRRAVRWPASFVDAPAAQFARLREKYATREPGRIALPRGVHDLWASHKYSAMARDPAECRALGRHVARLRRGAETGPIADAVVALLRVDPPAARLVNALEHMWGHVASAASDLDRRDAQRGPLALLRAVQRLATRVREPYLLGSTALSELALHARLARSSAG